MGLVGRRLEAAIAAGAAAVISTGLITAGLTAAPTPAVAATIDPRPQAVAPRLASTSTATTASTTSTSSSSIDSTLTSAIRYQLSRATAAGYGVVVDIAGRGRVVAIHPDSRIRPASTQKLFTTLPLLLADPDRRLVTQVR